MSTYEEFMIIINVASLIVAILIYSKHKDTKK
ncbi:putative holin-like toxin [Robinsoniella peoriensis]